MRFGHEQFLRPASLSRSAVLSITLHAVIVTAAIERNQYDTSPDRQEVQRRVIFYIPRDRTPLQNPQGETIQWIAYGIPESWSGELVDAPTGQSLGGLPALTPQGDDQGEAEGFSVATAGLPGDTVFSILQVEEQARRYEWSAAPVYPQELLRRRIEGRVSTRYVVDTTGWADMRTYETVDATHPEFAQSVREALPLMRFAPARIGVRRVRQLVEQDFTFKINEAAASAAQPQVTSQRAPR